MELHVIITSVTVAVGMKAESVLCCVCFFSDELRQLRTEREDLEKETERWKAEQTKERDKETQQHKYVYS